MQLFAQIITQFIANIKYYLSLYLIYH